MLAGHIYADFAGQVSAGARHSLALSRQGVVWAFGLGEMGQLGLGDVRTRLSPQPLRPFRTGVPLFVVAAGDHSIAVTRSGADAPSSVGERDVLVYGSHGRVSISSAIPDPDVTEYTLLCAGPADQYGAGLAALSLPSLPTLAEAAASDGPQAMVGCLLCASMSGNHTAYILLISPRVALINNCQCAGTAQACS